MATGRSKPSVKHRLTGRDEGEGKKGRAKVRCRERVEVKGVDKKRSRKWDKGVRGNGDAQGYLPRVPRLSGIPIGEGGMDVEGSPGVRRSRAERHRCRQRTVPGGHASTGWTGPSRRGDETARAGR